LYVPDVLITVVDPLRPDRELGYYPGATTLRMADVVVVNKIDSAAPADVESDIANVKFATPGATLVRAASPVTLESGPSITGRSVLVIQDGPMTTLGHAVWGMSLRRTSERRRRARRPPSVRGRLDRRDPTGSTRRS